MNTHLNIFKSYSRDERNYQLENDLTRALAICLSEDNMFLHEIIYYILNKKKGIYEQLFSQTIKDSNILIDIQKKVTDLEEFTHLFAVSLSGAEMNCDDFFNQTKHQENDPITDMLISINDIAIIFEVKPNESNCTAQLYNQASIALGANLDIDKVTPVDLNWKNLMEQAQIVANFQNMLGKQSRFLNDFIELIRKHNPAWLPQIPFNSQTFKNDTFKAYERLEAGLAQAKTPSVGYNDRSGFTVDFGWSSEILFDCIYEDNNSILRAYIWPGNTKGQGSYLFSNNSIPVFEKEVKIQGRIYKVHQAFHLKFTHFQKFITALEGTEDELIKDIVTSKNFREISGRKKRNENDWEDLQNFFDVHFKKEFDWRSKCNWEKNFINTDRSYFDLSFGYCLVFDIPLEVLQEIDYNRDDLEPLANLLDEIKEQFENILIK